MPWSRGWRPVCTSTVWAKLGHVLSLDEALALGDVLSLGDVLGDALSICYSGGPAD